MEQKQNPPTRKKIILWGLGILTSLSALKFFNSARKKKKDTVKMLTQDGKLVEIDRSLLASGGKKVTNEELQGWVKHKSSTK